MSHFHRSNYQTSRRNPQEQRFTVLNQLRVNPFAKSEGFEATSRISREPKVAEKIGVRDTTYKGRWMS